MPWIPLTSRGADDSATAPSAVRRFGARVAIVAFGLAVVLGASVAATGAASAQTATGILAPGNAVVTGFSGVKAPAAAPAGTNPVDLTEIDLSGPSARIVDLQSPGAPPQAQLINAPKPFTATAAQIGQVFAVTLDDATPPNVYVAATSAYGLPIIAPGRGGGPVRIRQGAPTARFMPGLFGPATAGGGPGSIWRIDGATGAVKLFANVMLDGVANSGAALGGLAFDSSSRMLFAADRGTGMIHAFDQSGVERARFDHGVDGRMAAGLPPVPYDAAGRLDIARPAFKTDDPATWGYAARDRRIFGLAVHAGRLYYATADEQVWSVAIAANGTFGADARVELQVQPWDGTSEISKITFDDQGGMLLAERPAPSGAYDFNALAREGVGRVLHYQQVTPVQADQSAPGDQPQPVNAAPAPGPSWQPVPDEYAIGFPRDLRNGNGGVAIGYGYTPSGAIDRAACGGFMWSTGEQLRVTADQALAAQLAAGGPAIVNGLQGNAIEAVRPANVPPLATYFVDYDDQFADPAARGHMGDVAIWRACSQAFVPAFPAPSLVVPAGFCERDQIRLPNGECCERRSVRNGRCGCPPDTVRLPNGQCCPQREIRNGQCCTPEEIRNGKCCPPDAIRLPNGRCCTPQEIRNGKCCTPEQIRNGRCCPPDTIRQPNGQCCTPEEIRAGRCGCPPGQIRLPNGVCCNPQSVRDGRCVPPPTTCPPGQILTPNGTCCDRSLVRDGRCVPPPPTCPPGQTPTANGTCQPPATLVPPVPPRRHWSPPRVRPPHREPRHVTTHWTRRGTVNRAPHTQSRGVHFGGFGGPHRR